MRRPLPTLSRRISRAFTRPLWATALAAASALLPSAAGAAFVVFEGAGADPAAITSIRDSFRSAVGGGSAAGANGDFGGLRREINWDGVPAGFSDPNALPGNFFNVNSPRGAVFSTPGSGFLVSGNAGGAVPTLFGFGGDLSILADPLAAGQALPGARAVTFAVTHDIPNNQGFRGLLLDLDPHSAYLRKDDLQALTDDTSGRYGGLGIEVQVRAGVLTVIAPIDDTPAARAGIQPARTLAPIASRKAMMPSPAEKAADSWWPDYAAWLKQRGEDKDAPDSLGSKAFPVRSPAPGEYVHEH
mgnify:CR=1 FL=1